MVYFYYLNISCGTVNWTGARGGHGYCESFAKVADLEDTRATDECVVLSGAA